MAENFASGFASGFATVDAALSRRRQMADMERRTGLFERATESQIQHTRHSERMDTNNDRRAASQDTRLQGAYDMGVEDRKTRLHNEAMGALAKQAAAWVDMNPDEPLPEALRLQMMQADRSIQAPNSEFTGFDGDVPLVSGTRQDGSAYENLPATERGVPVADGGAPLHVSDEELITRFAQYDPAAANSIAKNRERARERAEQVRALGAYADHINQQGDWGSGGPNGEGQMDPIDAQERPRVAVELENPFEGPLQPGFRRLSTADLGLPSAVEELAGRGVASVLGRFEKINVPDWFKAPEEMKAEGMTVQQVGEQTARQRAWFEANGGFTPGNPNYLGQRSVQQQKRDSRELGDQWGAFLNPEDTSGTAMRESLAADPERFLTRYARERNRLRPAERQKVDAAMYPVLQQRRDDVATQLREQYAAPEGSGDLWDLSSPEAQKLHGELKRTLAMEQTYYREYDSAQVAGITRQSMPTGNAQLTAQVLTALENRPQSLAPLTHSQVRPAAAVANAHKRNERPGGGRRQVSAELIRQLPILHDADMIDGEGIRTLLETGSTQGFKFHNLGGAGLHRQNPDGSTTEMVTMVVPDRDALARSAASNPTAAQQRQAMLDGRAQLDKNYETLQEMFDRHFDQKGYDLENPNDRRAVTGYFDDLVYQLGRAGPEVAERYGVSSEQMSAWTPTEMMQLVRRYDDMQSQRNGAAEHWTNWIGVGNLFKDSRRREFDRNHTLFDFDTKTGTRAHGMPNTQPELFQQFREYWGPQFSDVIEDTRGRLINEHGVPANKAATMTDFEVFEEYERRKTDNSSIYR